MGEGKRKAHRRQEFLQKNPLCAYCGAPAKTEDHCPPRGFFFERKWPETYVFPACEDCNQQSRLDEQALSALILFRHDNGDSRLAAERDHRLKGVFNNQPLLAAEWLQFLRGVEKKRFFRTLGPDGDRWRLEGWNAFEIGPLTDALITRFMIKLTKALYYRHNGKPFDGVVYAYHANSVTDGLSGDLIDKLMAPLPDLAEVRRGNEDLRDQFLYRFVNRPEALYALVWFSPQFIFQLMALGDEMDKKLLALEKEQSVSSYRESRHEARLGVKPG